MPRGWEWDETLYLGSAPYYAQGRLPYAPGLADRLAETLRLDGEGRLVDVGCGPGILALALAHLFAEVVGVDPDAGMLEEGDRRADAAGIDNVRWLRARAEAIPTELGPFRVATFGQSFHWMERERVAALVLGLLEPRGALVHVSDRKDALAACADRTRLHVGLGRPVSDRTPRARAARLGAPRSLRRPRSAGRLLDRRWRAAGPQRTRRA